MGDLRTQCLHLSSGNQIVTDAPLDNKGRGEAFSPTDLVATALASCMLTVMGIAANERNIELKGSRAEVKKVMASSPRRIEEVHINLFLPQNVEEKARQILENTAKGCPVARSLSAELKQNIHFNWNL